MEFVTAVTQGVCSPAERKQVRRALPDSGEALVHATHIPAFLLGSLAAGTTGRERGEPRLSMPSASSTTPRHGRAGAARDLPTAP